MSRTKSHRRSGLPLLLHLGLTVVVLVVGVIMVPRWHRQSMIRKLTAPSEHERERGLNYVIRRAGVDRHVLASTVRCLGVDDRVNFLQIVNALDRAGQWQRPTIPNTAWLRWLNALCEDPIDASRLNATHFLAALTDLADHHRVHEILGQLLDDPQSQVRNRALMAAGQLTGHATEPSAYTALLAQATADPSPELARQAWIFLGLMEPAGGISSTWHRWPTPVAQAILWAAITTNPDQPDPALEALADGSIEPSMRAMAAYCLHISQSQEAVKALTDLIERAADTDPVSETITVWRAVLGVGSMPGRAGLLDPQRTPGWFATPRDAQPNPLLAGPIVLSAYYRGFLPSESLLKGLATGDPEALGDPLALLAILEGLPVGQAFIPVTADMPPMLQLTAVAVTRAPDPKDLWPLFTSDVSTLRDLACVVARDRFTDQQLDELVGSLLTDFSDNAKMSGAIMAGLTGRQSDLLAQKVRDEDIWSVRQIMELGLWMQGRAPQIHQLAPGLLSRDDLPTTTVLLALLHRRHPAGLEHIFNPDGDAPSDLIDLLDRHRWWRVLSRYLPDDAPPFWVWADVELEQFQLEVLRNWYILNRQRLDRSS